VSRIESEALVVRTVEFGEADVIVTLVTEQVGKLSAIARGARKGSKRLGGSLEPVHTIAVMLEDRGGELATLKEARVTRARSGLTSRLDALEAAGVGLRWARHAFPPRTREPQGWHILIQLLDVLDEGVAPPRRELTRAGLAMLGALGYALDLEQCVVCGRPCAPTKMACVDPVRGGLVCRACGGAATVLLPELRRAARALAAGGAVGGGGGEPGADVTDAQAATLLELVDRAMAAHAGFER
jgi:DNA repair protein RecO (recombination protein O)